ncbi:C3HC4-type zinc-finger domain-containing protein [Giardia muris]|uniref:C3HC4-type zinc-finger domain-containing protein n=1 Tax=Giardia muris TaxID=5742 RepID=A0A4Z1T4F9_GIAMU|nr:C3HC4-type zinc-finger domain-containing protein [Giardia muris]|eukprot:TNJ27419.1 C3HC4-type zinc-finger domain-containing protein [Giardia muris]
MPGKGLEEDERASPWVEDAIYRGLRHMHDEDGIDVDVERILTPMPSFSDKLTPSEAFSPDQQPPINNQERSDLTAYADKSVTSDVSRLHTPRADELMDDESIRRDDTPVPSDAEGALQDEGTDRKDQRQTFLYREDAAMSAEGPILKQELSSPTISRLSTPTLSNQESPVILGATQPISPIKVAAPSTQARPECVTVWTMVADPDTGNPAIIPYNIRSTHICGVCMEPFRKPMTTRCNHTFCAHCIYMCSLYWRPQTCPACKTSLHSVPLVDDMLDSLVSSQFVRQPDPVVGDVVHVLTTSPHVYAFEVGIVVSLAPGYVSESRQQAILTSAHGKSPVEAGQKFIACTVARVETGGRVWMGRLADLLVVNPDNYPLGTRPLRGSIVIDSRFLQLRQINLQLPASRISPLSDAEVNERLARINSAFANGEGDEENKDNDSDGPKTSMQLGLGVYSFTHRRCELIRPRKIHTASTAIFSSELTPDSRARFDDIRAFERSCPLLSGKTVKGQTDEASPDRWVCYPDRLPLIPQYEFPHYFNRNGAYGVVAVDNASASQAVIYGAGGVDRVTSLLPYLTVVTNLVPWIHMRDFCCVGCKQLLRLPTRLHCGHFYCYNCATDSLLMGWPCLGCGTQLRLTDLSPMSAAGLASVGIDRYIPIAIDMCQAIQLLFPEQHVMLDRWVPVRVQGTPVRLGVLLDDVSYGTVHVGLDPDAAFTVSVASLTAVDLYSYIRPALRPERGIVLLRRPQAELPRPLVQPKGPPGVLKKYRPNSAPCEFFSDPLPPFPMISLAKSQDRRQLVITRGGLLAYDTRATPNPLLLTALQLTTDFASLKENFNRILQLLHQAQEEKELAHLKVTLWEQYMSAFRVGYVKDDIFAKRASPEVGKPERAVSMTVRTGSKVSEQAVERQRYQTNRRAREKRSSGGRIGRTLSPTPFSRYFLKYKEFLEESHTLNTQFASFRVKEDALLRHAYSHLQGEDDVAACATLMRLLIKYYPLDIVCTACLRVVRRPTRLSCGHLVCRTCGLIYCATGQPCLECWHPITSLGDLTEDHIMERKLIAHIPRTMHGDQIDIGSFVTRAGGRERRVGIVLATSNQVGIDYVLVQYATGQSLLRMSEVTSVYPAPPKGDVDPLLPQTYRTSAPEPGVSLVGLPCVIWPDIQALMPYRGFLGLVCSVKQRTADVTLEIGTVLAVPVAAIRVLTLVGPQVEYEKLRTWAVQIEKEAVQAERREREREVEKEVLQTIDIPGVKDLGLTLVSPSLIPEGKRRSYDRTKLPIFIPVEPGVQRSTNPTKPPIRKSPGPQDGPVRRRVTPLAGGQQPRRIR